MLSTAASLAILTTAAAIVVYNKLPRRIRRFLEKHSLMTDILCLFATYHLLGGTITALLAAGMVSLAVSGLLEIANNEQKYLVIYDLKRHIKQKVNNVKDSLNDYCEAYKQQKQLDMSRMQESQISP